MDDLWATKSEDVGLIIRAVSFQDFQPMWSWTTTVTDRQTDGQTTCNSKTALCTLVHCTVIKRAGVVLCVCRKRRGAINAKQLAYLERYHPKSRLKSHRGGKNGHNSCRLMWTSQRVCVCPSSTSSSTCQHLPAAGSCDSSRDGVMP